MSRIHDLGGKDGFGPVAAERTYVPFHATWEGVSFALMMETAPDVPIDWLRRIRELSPPEAYRNDPYFSNWAMVHAVALVDAGVVSLHELETGHAEERAPAPAPVRSLEDVVELNRALVDDFERPAAAAPRFAVGDTVVTRPEPAQGHTRLPAYACGARGIVHAHHGAHVYPDAMAKGTERAEHLYTIAFEAQTLFADETERHSVLLDLWDPYLDAP